MGMRPITSFEQPFNVPTTNTTAGSAKRVGQFDMSTAVVAFHSFDGVTPGSYDLEGTIDGANWSKISTAITSDSLVTLTHFWQALRVYATTAGASAPTVSLGAYEQLY